MKIMITGANGQLGKVLVHTLGKYSIDVVALGRNELDVTNGDECRGAAKFHLPAAIIHCAAYTAVDQAESEQELAFQINGYGTRNMAAAAQEVGSKLCYISTDYVFDGRSGKPYTEGDQPNPLNQYGKSKRAGELYVESICSNFFIVRTSWLYGGYGNHFVRTMLDLARQNKTISVVDDQFGSPTYAADLAEFLVRLVQSNNYGLYHASNSGSCSWHEFAKAIFELSEIDAALVPCTTQQFVRPVLRPRYSVLNHAAARNNGFAEFRHWREALADYLKLC
ncbi:dTDP-4-dehydrorhamnose reductase [Paenibacillus sp. GCM10027627]|uniref:dTDP-4-dehydrorhamnose reductase n=1 Tax=unclassified Paenibacillus TaxID=185978 RepID=UPI003643DE65